MTRLEVFDTVVLKANRQLVGIVDRTHYKNNEPLDDILIIAHVQVDQTALTEFVTTGTPPKNYVFVRFSDEAQGNSLVHENDVVLLDRNLNLGDIVKRENSHVLGTIANVRETFVLQPVWLNMKDRDSAFSAIPVDAILHTSPHTCTAECPFGVLSEIEHPLQRCLLHDIPGQELKKAEDVLEADYILQGDYLGVADELKLMVIVLLEDESIVVVKEPDELYIPVQDSGKPFVSLPEFDNLARPDVLVAHQGWSATIPPHDFLCGQMVITNQKNLYHGRWIQGQFDPKVKPQGRILDVRSRSIDVRWLASNAFMSERPGATDWPSSHTHLYENINTFPKRSELRSNKQISIYDHSRFPRKTESRKRSAEEVTSELPMVHLPTDFRVGDHVKFRDQAGAALKYQGVACPAGVIHGRFDRISSTTTFGFDVNEFKVICARQVVTVHWQDGAMSEHPSTNLVKFTLFEPELAPADLVVAREGLKQIRGRDGTGPQSKELIDFNEMKFFENSHDLLPERVGIVQTVDQNERVAQIRWFVKPKIRLKDYGHILSPTSRLGHLSETIEDISLYEIMTFPALMRGLRDLVIIPPSTISAASAESMRQFDDTASQPARLPGRLKHAYPLPVDVVGQTMLSHVGAQTGPHSTILWLQPTAIAISRDGPEPKIIESNSYKLHPAMDWVGEIVRLGLDGTITVRVNARDTCQDVLLEHDQVICFIDAAAISGWDHLYSEDDDVDMNISLGGSDGIDTPSTISETVEYEGGERIDDDSGDDNWEDEDDMVDDDDAESEHSPFPGIIKSNVTNAEIPSTGEHVAARLPGHTDTFSDRPSQSEVKGSFTWKIPFSEPPSFAVLEHVPPSDQHQDQTNSISTSPSFLKRVAREHRILMTSLPKGKIFVRTYENRLDLMRCLIFGPPDTPYEHAPFLIDLQLGKNFPQEPPIAHFHSWTGGLGRINPNLYEEGKICLSLLGTWPGKAEGEGWSDNATILQLLVSLQGLVFVRQPFYNEAGFEEHAEDDAYIVEAQRYNEKAYVMARGFIKHAMISPVQGLEDVLAWTYLPHANDEGLLYTTISRSKALITNSRNRQVEGLVDGTGSAEDQTKVFLKPLSRGAIVMLEKTIGTLENLAIVILEKTIGTLENLANTLSRPDVTATTDPRV